MAKVMMVTSGKGGVGKSTIAANLGMTLALDGYKVCLLDADIGLKNLDILLGLENRVLYDLYDVMQGNCSLDKALIKDKHCRNLYLLPTCKSMQLDRIRQYDVRMVVEELKKLFDYILIDSPAGIEAGFHQALSCSDGAIVVVQLEVTSLQDADRVVGLLHKHGCKDIQLVINRVKPDYIKRKIQLPLQEAQAWLSLELLGVVYEDEEIISANNRGFVRCMQKDTLTSACFQAMKKRFLHETCDIPPYRAKNVWQRIFS